MAAIKPNLTAICSPRLTGPSHLVDAPLTVEDWRIVHHAYMAFMTTVRRVAHQAYERQERAAQDMAPASGDREGS